MTKKPHQARKRFGQNFLTDTHIIDKLIRLINPKPCDNMVEIGPGQGALTQPLLAQLNALNAIEIDRDLHALLSHQFADQHLILHQNDALKFDFKTLIGENPLRVVGNLPYNISTPLIFELLAYRDFIQDMHFMLQLEVVERLAATHNNKTYGRISVICQYYCQVDQCFVVPPTAFSPAPKVVSAIVKLTPRPFGTVALDDDLFIKVVKTSFSHRRKTLKNNLKNILSSDQLAHIDQDISQRPEQLSVDNYVKLTNNIYRIINR